MRIGGGAVLTCSFCGKTQHQTRKVIAGPGVFICDECVRLCDRILEEELGERPAPVLDEEIEAAAREARAAVDRLRVLARQGRTPPEPGPPE